MTRQVRFRPEALSELLEAVDWYEARGSGLGAEFLRSLDAAIASIQRHPQAYPAAFGEARRAVLRRFPYSVIYLVSGEDILVVACFHGRRDPQRWQERLE